ncbi:hypothetical protein ACHAWF_005753 [Thalassiosira exigua]
MPSRRLRPPLRASLAPLFPFLVDRRCCAFAPALRRKPLTRPALPCAAPGPGPGSVAGGEKGAQRAAVVPRWIPAELAELAAEDSSLSPAEFALRHADAEACTSCDDEGDDFHECDFFGQYLGPIKWIRLTDDALRREVVGAAHVRIWEDVWSRPSGAVELAEKVAKDCLRYYNEFFLEPLTRKTPAAAKCHSGRPPVRVKVVPASFGLEGFEDATWEAAEDLLLPRGTREGSEPRADETSFTEAGGCGSPVTLVAAAPDLFTDPFLSEESGGRGSPSQAEFAPDRFRDFMVSLREKLALFSETEGVRLDETVRLTPFHPLWRPGEGSEVGGSDVARRGSWEQFPYPCIAVSTKIGAEI